MKYLELDFIISPYSRDAADILMALVADAGLESFVDTPQGGERICANRTFRAFRIG